ncbi:hypothetical protein [uncultured Maricaulis sp.]|uniref:hypothetical protein n=1 Tax=uncultured Maricaulis sp. TaxID=174710 RepID=UPI0030DAFC69
MKTLITLAFAATALSATIIAAPALAQDSARTPAGQSFSLRSTDRVPNLPAAGYSGTIRFEGGGYEGGSWTVSGFPDAMGEDPFSGEWSMEANGEIIVSNDMIWNDPYAAGDDRPSCREWPDYPIGTPIEDVGGEWGSSGVCWVAFDGETPDWEIIRIE